MDFLAPIRAMVGCVKTLDLTGLLSCPKDWAAASLTWALVCSVANSMLSPQDAGSMLSSFARKELMHAGSSSF